MGCVMQHKVAIAVKFSKARCPQKKRKVCMSETMLFTYRVLHDIWLMGHPRMTLYLMAGQTRTTTKQETDGRKRVITWKIYEKETLQLYSKWKNVNSVHDAFKLEQPINKSSHTFIIHGQGLCSVQTAEKSLMLLPFYGHPHPFAGLVLKTRLTPTWIAEVDRYHVCLLFLLDRILFPMEMFGWLMTFNSS